MSVPFKPHSITAYLTEEALEGAVIVGHRNGAGVSLQGMMAPTKSDVMYDEYGVETKRGWIFMADPEAEPAFREGGRIQWGNRLFAVVGGPQLFTGFGSVDHVSVPLEEILGGVVVVPVTRDRFTNVFRDRF